MGTVYEQAGKAVFAGSIARGAFSHCCSMHRALLVEQNRSETFLWFGAAAACSVECSGSAVHNMSVHGEAFNHLAAVRYGLHYHVAVRVFFDLQGATAEEQKCQCSTSMVS